MQSLINQSGEANANCVILNELSVLIDVEIAVQRGKTRPTGPIHLTNENASLDTDWTTAAGTGSYPGKLLFSSQFDKIGHSFLFSFYINKLIYFYFYHISCCLLQVLLWLHC